MSRAEYSFSPRKGAKQTPQFTAVMMPPKGGSEDPSFQDFKLALGGTPDGKPLFKLEDTDRSVYFSSTIDESRLHLADAVICFDGDSLNKTMGILDQKSGGGASNTLIVTSGFEHDNPRVYRLPADKLQAKDSQEKILKSIIRGVMNGVPAPASKRKSAVAAIAGQQGVMAARSGRPRGNQKLGDVASVPSRKPGDAVDAACKCTIM